MPSLEGYLVDSGVISATLLTQAQERAQREGVCVWEALHALDSEFIARALEPKRAYYYRRDSQQFKSALLMGQPIDLRTYFPPNFQRIAHQDEFESAPVQRVRWGFAPLAWTEGRIWVVSERPVSPVTALRTLLLTKHRLHRLPAPPEQVDDYRQLLEAYLWHATGFEGPIIRAANTILMQAIAESATAIEIELRPERHQSVVRYFINGEWIKMLTLPNENSGFPEAYIIGISGVQVLMLRYKHMAEIRVQVEPVEDFGVIRIRFKEREYDLAVFTRIVGGHEQMTLRFVRETPVPLRSLRQ
jgi:hypothetical protein